MRETSKKRWMGWTAAVLFGVGIIGAQAAWKWVSRLDNGWNPLALGLLPLFMVPCALLVWMSRRNIAE